MFGRRRRHQILGVIDSATGEVSTLPLERRGPGLWGRDARGRLVWPACGTVRLLQVGRGRPQPYILLRRDTLDPVTLPGEEPAPVTLEMKGDVVDFRYRGLKSGHEQATDRTQLYLRLTTGLTVALTAGFLLMVAVRLLPQIEAWLRRAF